MYEKKYSKHHFNCPVEATLSVIGGRWKPMIIFQLIKNKCLRFGQLNRAVNGATQRMLTKQLRELEMDKIIVRKVYAEVPPKVEYYLTDYGHSLKPIMLAMREWGAEHMGMEVKNICNRIN